ncbi:MAG TPA: Rieske 2Fe-2S domain-containing protein [Steroidobacteraceae bacterium]|jgi:nitrite reductase/ring-hydroxylating ferredoxin subunit|nr:Rieske 2Fe-2S domain-containing protein [Steroidobacteraceae bacterium]
MSQRQIDLARVLCSMADLPADGCREFRLGRGDWPLRGFVVRVADGVRAYVNRCAHQQFQLNYARHEFLTPDGSMILCRVHGALFEKQTGYCVAGPCYGRSLIGLPVRVESGYVLLADDADAEELAARYA